MALPKLDSPPITDLISLRGRVAVVTGGAKGIGLGIARRLAEAGAAIAVADLDEALGPAAAEELSGAYDVQSIFRRVDVRDPAQVEAVADAAVDELGGLDIWANIAGVYPVTADEFQVTPGLTDDEWARMIGINLNGTFYGARAAATRMI